MTAPRQDETEARLGGLYLLLAAGAIPIIYSAFHGSHWDTFSRWYALPTALIVLGRSFFGWFRPLVGRVIGAGAFYLTVAAVCSAVITWWNWMAFVVIAVLGALLVLPIGRHAFSLLVALASTAVAQLKHVWDRWRAEPKLGQTEHASDSVPRAGVSPSSPVSDVPDEENEPVPNEDQVSDNQGSNTSDEDHRSRSRLGRLAGTGPLQKP